MEPASHPLGSRLCRRLAFLTDMFWKLLAILRPPAREVRSTRMCPLVHVSFGCARVGPGLFVASSSLTTDAQRPSVKGERVISSYSFRSSELSQPI